MTFRPYIIISGLLLLLCHFVSRATEPLKGDCSAIFVAGATMEKDFTGKATSRVCRVSYRAEETIRVMDIDVEFHWSDLTTEHEKRDTRMRNHFLKGGFEFIRGAARGISLPTLANAGPERPVTIPITMEMGGVTNQVHGLVTAPMVMADGRMRLDVELKISQEKFGYDAITLLGFMSVRDEVVVQARFILPPDAEAPAANPGR